MPVLEIVMFKLREDVENDALLKGSEVVQARLEQYPGYIRRELFNDGNGQWIDLVYWNSLQEAHHAAEDIMQHAEIMPFMEMIDESSISMRHLEQVATFN